jgi:hypothetical protein
MKTSLNGWLPALALLTALAGACGDDDKPKDPGDGGGGGPSAPSDAATTTIDGATRGDASTVNSPSCPATAPRDEAACDVTPLNCRYGRTSCDCVRPSPADPKTWECANAPGGPMQTACPMAEPASGSACTNVRGECMFSGRVCDCLDNDTWACWNPADCPAAMPAEQAACTTVGMSCEYRRSDAGAGGECDCETTGWDCGRQFCPPAKPALGGQCESGDGTCSYSGEVCDCRNRMWACWNPSDCPATAPAENAACTVNGMVCPYSPGSCECDNLSWDCTRVPRPADAGVVPRDGGAGGVDGGLDGSL